MARMTLPSIRLSSRSAASLSNHIKFLKYLISEEFYNDFRAQFQRVEVIERIQALARLTIVAEIYAAYKPETYIRTENLLNSFFATTEPESDLANVVLYSDPTVAEAKLIPDFSYAEFFDPKSAHKSFIPADAKPIRPFFDDLVALLNDELPIEAIRSFEAIIKGHLPK